MQVYGKTVGNRFTVLPMEGWDGTVDGRPTELTFRRWKNFGLSGAKLIWGGEAVAVCGDGRSNPHQLWINSDTVDSIKNLRNEMVKAHSIKFGNDTDLFVGLQLSHSGRFSIPYADQKNYSKIVYRHPILDKKAGLDSSYPILTDNDLECIIQSYIQAALLVQEAGFDFVDLKHCHGYLGHELLSAIDRKGDFGGCFENRTLFMRKIIEGI